MNRPRQHEDEYFIRRDAEPIRQSPGRAAAARAAAQRTTLCTKTPRDGYDLHAGRFEAVPVQARGRCHGIRVDARAIDAVAAHRDPGLLGRVLRNALVSLRRREAAR
jgi:hypothetical protein